MSTDARGGHGGEFFEVLVEAVHGVVVGDERLTTLIETPQTCSLKFPTS